MKEIPLIRGMVALIDDADFETVSQFNWSLFENRGRFYARRRAQSKGKQTHQFLHSFLMPGVALIDHIDGNGLNNQRYNLRPATNQQNCQGFCRKRPGATSRFRGVNWCKASRKWRAQIRIDGQNIYLGLFTDEVEAAKAFDIAARKHRGEFAQLNFP